MNELKSESGFEFEKELTRIYNRLNHHFWNDELPEVIITFKPTKGALGHISSQAVWISDIKDNKYELNISAYTLNRDPYEICETILHEQCHLYNIIHDITDCSNYGRYHNSNFKHTAEEHGLNVHRSKHFGWSQTTLDNEARKYIAKLNIKRISYKYTKENKSKTLIRYICPSCMETRAWTSSSQYLICGYCKERLIHQ